MNTPEMNAFQAMLDRHAKWHEEHDASDEAVLEEHRETIEAMNAEMRAVTRRASVAIYGSEVEAWAAAEAWGRRNEEES